MEERRQEAVAEQEEDVKQKKETFRPPFSIHTSSISIRHSQV